MAKDYFRFQQFTIYQSRCAMKVGTDGTLLGAWAKGGDNILDVGTGTGLIALMMSQRFPLANVTGIDIDENAVEQAKENVRLSPYNVIVVKKDVAEMDGCYDSIVSNPPFFESSLECPDTKRNMARHMTTMTYGILMNNVCRLLSDSGEFSVVVPFDYKTKIEIEASLVGLFKSRECIIRTLPYKNPKRVLLAYKKHPVDKVTQSDEVIEDKPGVRSVWYQQLTKDFYL